jgi:tyrosinase
MDYTRRDFLKLSGAASLSVLATTGGCQTILNAISNRPTRKVLSNLSASDPEIQTYKAAVRQLRNRSSRPTWQEQANIHSDYCPHGNWYFLPWHRAYLHFFEEICREITGNEDFALPYWNWSINRSIPSTFWGSGNPLDHQRGVSPSDTASASVVGPNQMESILNSNSFIPDIASGRASSQRPGGRNFGELEQGPHNYIHGWVGGDMGTFQSPRDPIFWCHHAMVDCAWVNWNIDRQNSNSNDSQWTGYTFQNFVNRQGNPTTIDVQETLLLPLLAYQYESSQKGAAEPQIATRDTEQVREAVEQGADVSLEVRDRFSIRRGIEVSIGDPQTIEVDIEPQILRAIPGERQNNRLFLTVQEVKPPQEEDFFVWVFINRPNANRETPFDDPAFAGSFAFFNDAAVQDLNSLRSDYVLNITDEIIRLREMGGLQDGSLSLRLIAVPIGAEEDVTYSSFALEGIELALASPPKEDTDEQ